MDAVQEDFYYRGFPSNLLPARTPFTRAGRADAGSLFIYISNRRRRWSLLLNSGRLEQIYPEARKQVPPGFAHIWLLEKRFSTRPVGRKSRSGVQKSARSVDQSNPTHVTGLGESFVLLAEPSASPGAQGDVLSYHLQEAGAIMAAEKYTARNRRRAVVGLMVWDDYWF